MDVVDFGADRSSEEIWMSCAGRGWFGLHGWVGAGVKRESKRATRLGKGDGKQGQEVLPVLK